MDELMQSYHSIIATENIKFYHYQQLCDSATMRIFPSISISKYIFLSKHVCNISNVCVCARVR